jgi:hypothetical protein
MTWAEHHRKSEELASLAEVCLINGNDLEAEKNYRLAAEAEFAALTDLDISKKRTLGITVVSATALWFKAQEWNRAKRVAYQWLATDLLPDFAIEDLEEILREIWAMEQAKMTDRPSEIIAG